MKEEKLHAIPQNTRNHKIILSTITCEQIGQPIRKGQISRNTRPTKTESRRNS